MQLENWSKFLIMLKFNQCVLVCVCVCALYSLSMLLRRCCMKGALSSPTGMSS